MTADDVLVPASMSTVEELVTGHLSLVGHLARETAARLPRHLDTDDLVGAGALALVQAANTFDPTLGVPFARFAATRIRGAMIDQMRQRDWATRSVRSRARALATVSEQLTNALSRTPTDAELAAASGLSEAEVRTVHERTDRATVLSLDPLTVDDEGLAAGLEDTAARPDEALVGAERMGYLRDAIAELPERVRFVVSGYYLENRPLTEIAEDLKVTQSRASQLRAEGLDLLREALTVLLDDQSRVGPGDTEVVDGVRARRREAYVAAVAGRSTLRDRADVRAYLAGAPLVPAGTTRPGSAVSAAPGPAEAVPGGVAVATEPRPAERVPEAPGPAVREAAVPEAVPEAAGPAVVPADAVPTAGPAVVPAADAVPAGNAPRRRAAAAYSS